MFPTVDHEGRRYRVVAIFDGERRIERANAYVAKHHGTKVLGTKDGEVYVTRSDDAGVPSKGIQAFGASL